MKKIICRYLISKFSIQPIQIDKEKIVREDPIDVDIDVSGDPQRFVFDRSRPYYIKGTSVTIHVPFIGNKELFHYKPSTFTMNPPNGVITTQELILTFEFLESDSEQLKQNYQNTLSEIERYLEWIRKDIDVYNGTLEAIIKEKTI